MGRRRQWGEDSTVSIELSSGGSITLTFKGNLFDLSRDERELIANVSNVIQKFRDAQVDSASVNENEKSLLEAQRA